jgi:hypothetical protein
LLEYLVKPVSANKEIDKKNNEFRRKTDKKIMSSINTAAGANQSIRIRDKLGQNAKQLETVRKPQVQAASLKESFNNRGISNDIVVKKTESVLNNCNINPPRYSLSSLSRKKF